MSNLASGICYGKLSINGTVMRSLLISCAAYRVGEISLEGLACRIERQVL